MHDFASTNWGWFILITAALGIFWVREGVSWSSQVSEPRLFWAWQWRFLKTSTVFLIMLMATMFMMIIGIQPA